MKKKFFLKLLYVEIPLLLENPRSAWPYCGSGQLWSGSDLKVWIQILNKKNWINWIFLSFFLKLVIQFSYLGLFFIIRFVKIQIFFIQCINNFYFLFRICWLYRYCILQKCKFFTNTYLFNLLDFFLVLWHFMVGSGHLIRSGSAQKGSNPTASEMATLPPSILQTD